MKEKFDLVHPEDLTRRERVAATIEGHVEAKGASFAGLWARALVGGAEVARAAVGEGGAFKLKMDCEQIPERIDVEIFRAGAPAEDAPRFRQALMWQAFQRSNGLLRADVRFRLPKAVLKQITEDYSIEGFAAAVESGAHTALRGARLDFYWQTSPGHERFGATAHARSDGSFTLQFSATHGLFLLGGHVSAFAKVFQFVDGAWTQVHVSAPQVVLPTPASNVFLIEVPASSLTPTAPGASAPATGFRYTTVGLLPIDNTHLEHGYAVSAPGAGDGSPFWSTLNIFGLFAAGENVTEYTLEMAPGDPETNAASGAFTPVRDALVNAKWDDAQHAWIYQNLGPDPATGRYRCIDGEPEIDWLLHALKVTWNTAAVPDGYYVLRITGYKASGASPVTAETPVLRIDNTPPTARLTPPGVGVCGGVALADGVGGIAFDVTASQPRGHIARYDLSGTRGRDGVSAGATRTRAAGPWTAGVYFETFTVATLPTDLAACPVLAYGFELIVTGSATNGYGAVPRTRATSNLVVAKT
jgi:hypothetical protein